MADNTILNTGSGGDTLATDDISGIKYPRSKIVIGADGTNDGDVSSANPLPVKGTGTAGTANAGVVTVQGIASMTPLQIADNSGSLTIDNAALSVVGGGLESTALRVTLASDSTGVLSIDDNGGALTVDGTVAATQSGTWTVQPGNTANTTAWLVTGTGGTFPVTDSGGSLTIDNAALAVTGGGVEASALRVTLASDSTGLLSVDDNAGSLTVDAPVGTPVFVRLSDGASAITTLPVSLASVPSHAVTNAGTFAVQPTPATSGGLTMHTAVSAATNNATNVKASAGQVFGLQLMNKNASPRYFKLYNKATAPSPGSDTPVKTLMVPGNTAGSGMVLSWTMGLAFSTGIAYAVVAGIGTTDNTSVGAEDVAINMDYA